MSSQFGLTSFCVGLHVCLFVCLFVCLLFFEEAERRELRVEGEWGTPEGNRNESGN